MLLVVEACITVPPNPTRQGAVNYIEEFNRCLLSKAFKSRGVGGHWGMS